MGWKDFLGLKTTKVSTKTRVKTKKAKTRSKRAESAVEDPLITVTRQLTLIQQGINQSNTLLQSGFDSLREDHHKILEEQLNKADLEEYMKSLENRKQELEKEIEMLDVDRKILGLIEGKELQSVSVAQELNIARQYAATRLSALEKAGYAKKIKKGRKIYYKTKGG